MAWQGWYGYGGGGWRGQGRYRNMYYLTGLPGFVRFGYSPGWVGRSPTGLGPFASYLAERGELNKYISDLSKNWPYTAAVPLAPIGLTKEQRLDYLKRQYETIKSTLAQLEKEIKELEK